MHVLSPDARYGFRHWEKKIPLPGLKAFSSLDASKAPFGAWDLDSDKPGSDPGLHHL